MIRRAARPGTEPEAGPGPALNSGAGVRAAFSWNGPGMGLASVPYAIPASGPGRSSGGKVSLSTKVAATAVFLGAAANTLAKGLLAVGAGGMAFGKRVLTAQLVVLAVGACGAALTWLL